MDFMNLNQSAHGDREFAFIQTRLRRGRKTVVGHWQDPAGRGAAGRVDAGGGRLARGAPAQDRPVRRQHARGRGHRGRQGRGPGPARLLGQRLRRRRARRARRGGRRRRRSTRWSTAYDDRLRRGAGRCAAAATATPSCGRRPGSRPACGRSSSDGGFGAFTDTFEDLGALAQLPGHRRPAADGRRLRLRRRGRLEGRRARPDPQGDGRRAARRDLVHGGLHLPPRRPGARGPRRPHARGLPVDRRAAGRRARSTRSRSAAGPTRSGWSSTPRPGPPSSSASPTSATASGSSPARSTSSSPTRRCRSCRSPARSGGRGPTSPTAAEAWLTAGGPHHTALTTSARRSRRSTDFADIADIELVTIDAATTAARVPARAPLEPGVLLPRPRAVSVAGRAATARPSRAVVPTRRGDRPRSGRSARRTSR